MLVVEKKPTKVQWAQKPFYFSPSYEIGGRGKEQKEDEAVYEGKRATGEQNSEEVRCGQTCSLLLPPAGIDRRRDCSATRKELSFRKKFPLPISSLESGFTLVFISVSFFFLSPFSQQI